MRFRNTAVSFDHVFDARLPFEDEEVAMLAMDLVSTTEHVLDSSPHARLLSAQEGLSEAGIQERGAIQTQIIDEVFSGYGPYLDTLQSTLVAAGQEQVGGVVQSAAKAFIGEALDLCARRDGLGVWNIAMALKYSLKRFHRSRVLRLGREQALDSELGELREKI